MHFSGLNTLCSFTKYVTAEVSLGNVKFIFFYQRKILTLICYFNTTWIILSSWIRGPGKSWIEKSSSLSAHPYHIDFFEIGSLNLCDRSSVKSNLGPAWRKTYVRFYLAYTAEYLVGFLSKNGRIRVNKYFK